MFRRAFVAQKQQKPLPSVVTRNFIDFLVLYGFYGGDIIPEDEDELLEDEEDGLPETQPLLRPANSTSAMIEGTSGKKAFFMLLKAFVGTGILFLPKA